MPIPEEAKSLLAQVYNDLFGFGVYDPATEEIEKFARPLWEKMVRVNELLNYLG